MNTYIIELQSDTPPRVFIGDSVAGGQVVAIKDNTPSLVDAKWLMNATGLSRGHINDKLRHIAQGTAGKRLYNRVQALTMLANDKETKKGRPRKY